MSTTISAVAGTTGSGLGSERHAAWAPNGSLWWAFGYTSTTTLASWYSSDGVSWTASGTHTLAHAHNSEGRNLAVVIENIGGTDVVHFALPWKSGSNLAFSTVRATISGTSITYHSSETALSSATSDAGSLFYAGSAAVLGTDAKVHFANSWAGNGNGDVNSEDSGADAGTAEQMTPVSYTAHQPSASNSAESRAHYMVALASGNIGLVSDDGSGHSDCTGLSWFTWNGSSWTGDATSDDITGAISAIDKNDWGAVFVAPDNGHVVYRDVGTGYLVHRRYNGTSWGAGEAIPAQTNLAGGGVALCTDGASVWVVIIDTDASNTVRSCLWSDLAHNEVGDQWGSWQVVESSSATRTFVGVARDVAGSVALAYWSEGSNLVAAPFAAASPPDPGFYTWIQSNQGSTGTSATTFAVAFTTQNVVAGNRIIVAVAEWNSTATTVTSVTDTPGNTYVKDKDAVESDGTHISIWSAPITAGGGTKPTVTAHASASTAEWAMWVHEYSGVTAAPTNYLDGTNATTTSTAGSPITSGASTPAPGAANELAFGFYGDGGNNIATIGVSGGWTQRGSSIQGTGTTAEGACSDQPTSVGTGSNASFTLSNTGSPGGVLVAVYKLAPSGSSGGVPSRARTLSKRLVWRGLRQPIPYFPSVQSSVSISLASDPGSTAAISALSGTLAVQAALNGNSASVATLTASLAEAVALSASSAAFLSQTGTLALAKALSASSQAVETTSATLSLSVALGATSASVDVFTGSLSEAVALASALADVLGVSGNLQLLSGTQISATVVSVGQLSASLALSKALSAQVVASGQLSASLREAVALNAAIADAAGLGGNLSLGTLLALSGRMDFVSTLMGTFTPSNAGGPVSGPTRILGQAVNFIAGGASVRLLGAAANRLLGGSSSNRMSGGGSNQLGED